jgi:hypothetical protein
MVKSNRTNNDIHITLHWKLQIQDPPPAQEKAKNKTKPPHKTKTNNPPPKNPKTTPTDSLWFDPIGFEHTRDKHANHYTIDTVDLDALCNIKWQNLLGEHMFDIQ